ncbi:Cleavage stimulation factor subunit 2 [Coemansia sp. RSA 1939]|nr:Cleavage stimulation factor subunit 2 [Coemansia sp. RSA 1939]KAJ2590023.1 Cleavage stimulation factor subunit 2 [Coemansia sp. RSA 1804]KAJ2665273.1 Cleavage stimulation factor subunit 2 [Coemansia sp. RSA 1285]
MMEHSRFEVQQESNIVFLGNVAYETTEEQLRRMLELAGPVVDIKLLFDPVTNRAKGFGFCQYVDINTAASAIKNLNDTQVDGRNIKIGYADRDRVRRYLGTDGTTISGGSSSASRPPPGDHYNQQYNHHHYQQHQHQQPPPIPAASYSKPVRPENVDAIVASLSGRQKSDFLAQFRLFASFNPTKAREELAKNPALAYALTCSLEALSAVDQNTLARIKTSGSGGGGYSAPPGAMRASHMASPAHGRHPGPPPLPPSQAAGRMHATPPHSHPSYSETSGAGRAPVTPGTNVSDSHSAAGSASAETPASSSSEMNNAEVLKQLLSLTDEQLAQLPEDHRQQIVDLKRQLESA